MVYQFVRGRWVLRLSLRVFLITLLPPSGHFLVTLALAECLRYHGGGCKMGMFRCGYFVGDGRGEGGDRAIGWDGGVKMELCTSLFSYCFVYGWVILLGRLIVYH